MSEVSERMERMRQAVKKLNSTLSHESDSEQSGRIPLIIQQELYPLLSLIRRRGSMTAYKYVKQFNQRSVQFKRSIATLLDLSEKTIKFSADADSMFKLGMELLIETERVHDSFTGSDPQEQKVLEAVCIVIGKQHEGFAKDIPEVDADIAYRQSPH